MPTAKSFEGETSSISKIWPQLATMEEDTFSCERNINE